MLTTLAVHNPPHHKRIPPPMCPWRPRSKAKPAPPANPQRKHQQNVLYGRRWKARKAMHLQQSPLCLDCEAAGRVVPATDAHHVQRHNGDPVIFWSSELMSLCHSCHSKRTSKGE